MCRPSRRLAIINNSTEFDHGSRRDHDGDTHAAIGSGHHERAAEVKREHRGIDHRAAALLAQHVEHALGRADGGPRHQRDGEDEHQRIAVVEARARTATGSACPGRGYLRSSAASARTSSAPCWRPALQAPRDRRRRGGRRSGGRPPPSTREMNEHRGQRQRFRPGLIVVRPPRGDGIAAAPARRHTAAACRRPRPQRSG